MELKILPIIEEQMAVEFTGKVNILSTFNRQYLGHFVFKNGELIQVYFQQLSGLKAFYHIVLQEYSLNSFSYIIEPEVIDEKERKIHYPFAVIKNKMLEVITKYQESIKFRPPENVKIVINPKFIEQDGDVTKEEFEVLQTLAEWNRSFDIYQHCELLDHEITWCLVSLRKKGALKIVALGEHS